MEYFLLVKLFVAGMVIEWAIPIPADAHFPTCAPYMQIERQRLIESHPQVPHSLRCVRAFDANAFKAMS